MLPGLETLVGRVLGGTYRPLRRLDTGGMAVVFEAEHVRLPRSVAIKVLADHLSGSEEMLARFRREAEIVSGLRHPHVVQILDFDVADTGHAYLVMELLQGTTLHERVNRAGPLDPDTAIGLALQIASGLAAVHDAGVVHRDLKPENVFLVDVPGEEPFVKLIDFGISKSSRSRAVTSVNCIMGTLEYMAPEQAGGHEVDARCDQHALALMTYEMLCAQHPLTAPGVLQALQRVLTHVPPRITSLVPDLPEEVADVLARGLAKSPDQRFETIRAFASALARAAGRSSLRPSSPNSAGSGFAYRPTMRIAPPPPSASAAAAIRRALCSFQGRRIAEAARDAEAAVTLAMEGIDPDAANAVRAHESLLSRILLTALGPLGRRLSLRRLPQARSQDISPRAAFLLSRIEGGMTTEQALDVAGMPRIEALAHLVGLARKDLIALN